MLQSKTPPIRIELSESTLHRLLVAGHIGAADLRCLDCASKKRVWRLCLSSCIHKEHPDCADCPFGLCPERKTSSS